MTDPDLLDRLWAVEVAHNDERPLWDGDVDLVERWPATSAAATAAARTEALAARAEALAAVDDDPERAPSLRTVADALALVAATKDLDAEQLYPHPEQGLHSFLFWAVNDLPLRTAAHGEGYLAKLAGFPAAIDELCERLELAAAAARAPLRRHVAESVARLDAHLASPLGDDPLLAQAAPTALDEPAAARWRDGVAAAVRDDVRPALATLRATLQQTSLPAGRDDDAAGLAHYADPGVYAELLEAYTEPGTTPEQVHAIGHERVALLADQYRAIGAAVFGTADLEQVLARLRDDTSLQVGDAAAVMAEARRLHHRAEERAPDWFRRTPAAPCVVRPTEVGSLGFYAAPAPDGSRPGVFYLNTSEPGIWGPNLAATVFHEGIPGHHFQAALALEDDGLHDLHRRLFLPAYGEGWALYTERLADDMGLYSSDLQRLGMLMSDSLRACRLVVDTGMHALGWSRDRAITYLRDNTPLHEAEVVPEIDRYIASPGQATSYMWGRLAIEELRDGAAAALGGRFDLAAFHDVVLGHGMVSLPALRLLVERWLTEHAA